MNWFRALFRFWSKSLRAGVPDKLQEASPPIHEPYLLFIINTPSPHYLRVELNMIGHRLL